MPGVKPRMHWRLYNTLGSIRQRGDNESKERGEAVWLSDQPDT